MSILPKNLLEGQREVLNASKGIKLPIEVHQSGGTCFHQMGNILAK